MLLSYVTIGSYNAAHPNIAFFVLLFYYYYYYCEIISILLLKLLDRFLSIVVCYLYYFHSPINLYINSNN